MKARRIIRTSENLAQLYVELGNRPHPFTVTMEQGEVEVRSNPQNALTHRWYADAARQLDGYEAKDIRALCKLHFGVRILHTEDADFREKWDRLIGPRFTYEEKLELMLPPHDYPVTRLMNKQQMTQFMDDIQAHFARQQVRLTDPERMKA